MQLFGKISGDFCQADLLIEKGRIVVASFENLEKGDVYLGKDALAEIKGNFIKESKVGRLELYELDSEEMTKAKRANFMARLTKIVSLKDIGLRLKPHQPRKVKESKLDFQAAPPEKEVKKEVVKREIDTLDIIKKSIAGGKRNEELIGKRIPVQEIPKLLEGMEKSSHPAELKRKRDLLERWAKKKGMIDREIAERISKLFAEEKPPEKKVRHEGKVKTSIDNLYDEVQKNKSMKLNEALARKFRVSKTQLESWAIILEEHDLVELHYPTIGEPEIRRK